MYNKEAGCEYVDWIKRT